MNAFHREQAGGNFRGWLTIHGRQSAPFSFAGSDEFGGAAGRGGQRQFFPGSSRPELPGAKSDVVQSYESQSVTFC
jgi:hypothetical protein